MDLSRTIVRIAPSSLVLAVALGLAACGNGEPAEPADPGTAGTPQATASEGPAETPPPAPAEGDAPATASSTALPGWFPEDAWLPADYAVAEVNEDFGARQVELRLDGDIASRADEARAGMLAAGWTETQFNAPDEVRGANMHYTSGERSAMLTMARQGDGAVRLIYGFTLPE